MDLLVNCSYCHTALQLPPGAIYVRCCVCQAVTQVATSGEPPFSAAVDFSHKSIDLLVDCSHCHAPLCLPQGATSVRCVLCQAVTQVATRDMPTFSAPVDFSPAPYSYQPVISSIPAGHLQVHGQKRAVIIAVSYKGMGQLELNGCINDGKCMKFMLVNRFKFPEASVLMLSEEEKDPNRLPTKQNIRMAMYWLIQGCQQGDSLVFHYSGHGGQQKDLNGDELDGFDETICPMDFKSQGVITDDEINEKIVRPIPHGAKLHAMIDACHSGTVLDLPYLCRMNKKGEYEWENQRPKDGTWKGTSGGEVIAFSGCDDDQLSADTTGFAEGTSTGAMTYAFIEAIEGGHGATYGSILTAMRRSIFECITEINAGTRDGAQDPLTVLLTMLLLSGEQMGDKPKPLEVQEPQLTANEPFDVFAKPFSL